MKINKKKKILTIRAVNVVERRYSGEIDIFSYPDTGLGSIAADKKFVELYKLAPPHDPKEKFTTEHLNDILNQGFYENGSYELYISHS